jgi:hypothetical protein
MNVDAYLACKALLVIAVMQLAMHEGSIRRGFQATRKMLNDFEWYERKRGVLDIPGYVKPDGANIH